MRRLPLLSLAPFFAGAVLLLGAVDRAALPYREAVLEADPEAGVVAIAVRIPIGASEDPRGQEGTAFLLGRVLERQGNQALSSAGAVMSVRVDRHEFLATLLAMPGSWREAVRAFEGVLFRDDLSSLHVDAAREEAFETLVFEAGAPVRTFDQERTSFIFGALDPSARPLFGTSASLAAVGLPELQAFRALNFRAEESVLGATGPMSGDDLAAVLATPVRVLEARAPDPAPTVAGAPTPAGVLPPRPRLSLERSEAAPLEAPATSTSPPPWTTEERATVEEELTSIWISLALPFPSGTPPLLLDFVSHLVLEALTPSPPDPGLYEAGVMTLDVRGAPVLVVTTSVDPRAASRWEARLRETIANLAQAPPEGAFFELARRRFRSNQLLDLAIPENRAAWIARHVSRDPTGVIPDPARDVWRIRGPAVAALVSSAGPARVILFGPIGMMGTP